MSNSSPQINLNSFDYNTSFKYRQNINRNNTYDNHNNNNNDDNEYNNDDNEYNNDNDNEYNDNDNEYNDNDNEYNDNDNEYNNNNDNEYGNDDDDNELVIEYESRDDGINDERYIDFLKTNYKLTECQINTLIKYREQLNKKYTSVESNKQMYTYLIDNVDRTIDIAKMQLMLEHFCGIEHKEVIKRVVEYKLTDTQTIELIRQLNPRNNKGFTSYDVTKPECRPSDYMFQIIGDKLMKVVKIFEKGRYEFKYLDYGCGAGQKTLALSKALKLDLRHNIYGTDISTWGPYQQQQIKYPFNFKMLDSQYNIPFPINSFNMVSAYYTLHHITPEGLEHTFREIHRVLKPNGVFLIIEHNNYSDANNMLVELMHTMYGYFVDKKANYIEEPNYTMCHNKYEWSFLLRKYFRLIISEPLFLSESNTIKYDNSYYAIYRKE